MALQSSGAISIKNVQDEFSPTGGTGDAGIKFSEYYKNGNIIANDLVGGSIPNSGPISLSQFRGAMDYREVTIPSSNQYVHSNLKTLAINNGYDGTNPVRVTINSGYHIATDTGNYGMRTGEFDSELKVTNKAYIMGKGGNGGGGRNSLSNGNNGAGGGAALKLDCPVTSWTNSGNGAVVGGGGGGGSGRRRGDPGGFSAAGGGGGAGGGNGGLARSNSGTTSGGAGSDDPRSGNKNNRSEIGGQIPRSRGIDGAKRDSAAGSAENQDVRGRGGTAGGGGGGWGRDVNKAGNTSTATTGSGGGGGRRYPGSAGSSNTNDTATSGGSGGTTGAGGSGAANPSTAGGGGGWGKAGGAGMNTNGGAGGKSVIKSNHYFGVSNTDRFAGSISNT